jgi:thioesterase domain-containing protein
MYYLSVKLGQLPRALCRKIRTIGKRALRRTVAKTTKTCRKLVFHAQCMSIDSGKRRVYRVEAAHYHAKRAYAPAVYPGKITCFWPSEAEQKDTKKRSGWQKLSAEKIESHIIPGDHYAMAGEPNVRVLAKILKECLAKAKADSGKTPHDDG